MTPDVATTVDTVTNADVGTVDATTTCETLTLTPPTERRPDA